MRDLFKSFLCQTSGIRRLTTVLLLITLTSACGWQLRGLHSASSSTPLPDQVKLVTTEPNSSMARTLRRILTSKNIAVAADAPLALVLEEEILDKRPLSVTETGVTAQYQLVLTVRYRYKNASASNPLTSERLELSSWRSYDFDAKLIVAKNQEEQALLEEMREELAWRMLDGVPELNEQASNG